MDKNNADLHFKLMSFIYKIRDFFNPPINILKELNIKPGYYVLDFGCGPGSYSIAAAEIVGVSGKVFALDVNPLAIKEVQNIASKKKLLNIVTILSDCKTGLEDNCIDIVLLYDVFHHLNSPLDILVEINRVLKPEGILSFSDHHMKKNEILSKLENEGFFKLFKISNNCYIFIGNKKQEV
jgi:ubiquinone/menaquinone biosynthesis C-methylase UbiE